MGIELIRKQGLGIRVTTPHRCEKPRQFFAKVFVVILVIY